MKSLTFGPLRWHVRPHRAFVRLTIPRHGYIEFLIEGDLRPGGETHFRLVWW